MKNYDVIIIGAGAAGLMCAIEAAKRRRSVLIIDHANKVGKKILMSGGGRCNFTNTDIQPECYISHNPHFCKSALSQYTQWDFIALVEKHGIAYHEKTLGQLFCNNKSRDIVNMLLAICDRLGVEIQLNIKVNTVNKVPDNDFYIDTSLDKYHCQSLVVATGGLSIPTMGASPFGYQLAEKFGLKVWPTRAALVPFTLQPQDKEKLAPLSGVSVPCIVHCNRQSFRESLLFTHRGLSGPSMLQISSYWQAGDEISINLLPDINLEQHLFYLQKQKIKLSLKSVMTKFLPKRVVLMLLPQQLAEIPLNTLSSKDIHHISQLLHNWTIKPNGTEGYRTAEVTLGGVDCNAFSSKTMECRHISRLYFIGEVLDVTGWLGGYNFQWAWSSGWVAGQVA